MPDAKHIEFRTGIDASNMGLKGQLTYQEKIIHPLNSIKQKRSNLMCFMSFKSYPVRANMCLYFVSMPMC